jgi:hypothetical protein
MWVGDGDNDDEDIQQFLMVDLALAFKDKTDDDLICDAIIDLDSCTNNVMQMFLEGHPISIVKYEYDSMFSYLYLASPTTTNMPIEINLGKTLNISPRLGKSAKETTH